MRVFVLGAALVAVPALALQSPSGQTAKQAPTRPHEIVLYEHVSYGGGAYQIDEARPSVRAPWNIRSIGVHPGESWQICARPRFREPCIILSRSVHDATLIGVEGQIGSVRPASEATPATAN